MARPIRPVPIPQPRPGAGEVTPLLIKPGALRYEHTFPHDRATLTYLVEDVTGAGARTLMEVLRAPGLPRRGDPFDGNDALFVRTLNVTNIEDCTTKWEVVVEYGWPETIGGPFDNPPDAEAVPMLEIDSTVVIKRTNIDVDGNLIRIEGYHASIYDDDGLPIGSKAEAEPIQGGMVDVPVSLTVLRYSRREPPVDNRNRGVAFKSMLYTGKTNIEPIDASGTGQWADPHTWLCTRLGAVSDDGGLTFNVTYEFTFNPDKWRATAVYIDPKTGQPGDNLSILDTHTMSGNGVKTFQVVGAANFRLLDLYI